MRQRTNRKKIGNRFQEDFVKSCPSNVYVERYRDGGGKFKNVHNPADYFIFNGTFMVLVECKTVKTSSFPVSNVGLHQLWKMLLHCSNKNVFGGYLINFRKYNKTYFILVEDYYYWLIKRTRQSVPTHTLNRLGYQVSSQLKRTRYRYGIEGLLEWVGEVNNVL